MTSSIIIFRPDDGNVRRFTLRVEISTAIGYDKAASTSNDILLKELPIEAKDNAKKTFARVNPSRDSTGETKYKITGLSAGEKPQSEFTVRVNGELLNLRSPYLLSGDIIEVNDLDAGNQYLMQFIQPKRQPVTQPQPEAPFVWRRSSYLQLLPPIYDLPDDHGPGAEDDILNALLLIAETILTPLDRMIAQSDCYFDPLVAPEALLPWLKTWVGLFLKGDLPVARSRQLINSAAELYRWRGTCKGLTDYIYIGTGLTPQIQEPGPYSFRVIMTVPKSANPDQSRDNPDLELLWQILDSTKPAHTSYQLQISYAQANAT